MKRSQISSRWTLLTISLTIFAAGLLSGAEKERAKTNAPKGKKSTPLITGLPSLPAELHNALQERRFKEAIAFIEAALEKPGVKDADYLLYLKGRAETELQLYPAALATFGKLEKRYPQSRWVARARFGRADVYVRQRDYQAAGKIYQSEAQRLLSDERQDQLTGIYLEFADRYFEGLPGQGPGAEKKPDYQQALLYYREALKLRSGKKRRRKIEFRMARCLQELKQHAPAITAYRTLLQKYASKETPDEDRLDVSLEVQARYELGRTLLAARRFSEARKTWQDFLTSAAARKAGGDYTAQATYGLGKTFGIPSPPSIAHLEQGVAALEKFLRQFPQHKLAPQAEYEMALSYLHHGRFEQAVQQLKQLIANPRYRERDEIAQARRLLGETYLAQKKFDEAITVFRTFLEEHPTDRNWSAVQRRVIDAEYAKADEQRRQKNYEAARKLWLTFLNKYPLDTRAPHIFFAFGVMKYAQAADLHRRQIEAANKSGRKADPRQLSPAVRQLLEEALADWQKLVSKYPGTRESSQGAYMIGVLLEEWLGRLADALDAYKKVKGPYAPVAQARIAALTSRKLDVLTERTFRTSEKAVIKLRTRNIEKVTVKVYRIDMVDYFRKMHLAGGVETLDIALIDPDQSWTYEVDGYEKYRQITNDIEIPTNGPGVTAVTVSSEKLEATTMVLVSDIDIIVKASRNELFVFAENMRTQKPMPGVSLLISDGKKVFAEEITGKDGILQKSYDQLKTVQDLRIFAIHQGHCASTVSNLQGLKFAVGLAPKGYLYTDRPAYRSGELVHLKGIIRWVENDTYTFKVGEKYRLDVYDSRGRIIHTTDVSLGPFGTFADRWLLPATAPQGQYRVHLHQPGKTQSYETLFTVHEVQLEPVLLAVDLPRKVYYRGENIEGTITLKYYYGTPLPNRTIQYQLAGGRLHTATTDARGQVKFSFETTQYNESQQLVLKAIYPERNLGTQMPLFLATRGFAINVQTRRDVYIAGETFDAAVTITDPAGKPVATDITLEVFELLSSSRSSGGSRGEKLLLSYKIRSDKEKGEARQTLRIDKAGSYRLRATGKDRFGNTVSGEHTVRISGDDDHIRLRILAEKHRYRVGETAQVQLHWREEPALALVTFEGAKVLGYRLVRLNKGANRLTLPMQPQFAPNFVLSVAVMEKNRFHQAQSEFLVTRKLTITLKPDKTTLKPGDDLTVEVTTTDSQGKPVSAEISLALIQKNLLDRFAPHQGLIDAYFGGGYRQPSVRAFTSATFRYQPKTRGISKYLLAEEERRKILQAELNVRKELAQRQRTNEDAREKSRGFTADRNFDELDEAERLSRFSLKLRPGGPRDPFARPFDQQINGNRTPQLPDGANVPPNAPGMGGQSGGMGGFGGGGFGGQQQNLQAQWPGRFDAEKAAEKQNGPAQFFDRWQTVPGVGGSMPAYQTTLSLVIRQTQGGEENLVLKDLSGLRDGTIVAVDGQGTFQVVNGLPLRVLQKLTANGLHLLPGMAAAETGYWNPLVVTGKDGKATVTFRLPNRSTAWLLHSKGTDAGVLTGEAEREIITKKNLFGELKTPLAFYRGDKTTLLAEVHNATLKKGTQIDVQLELRIGNRTTRLKKTITSGGPGIAEVSFPLEITEGEAAEFTLTVTAGNQSDTTTASVPVLPFGMPVFATASGSSAQNTIVFIQHDKQLDVQNPTMEIVIGPSINRTLLDAVLGGGMTACESILAVPGSGIERNVSDIIGGVSLLKMIRSSRNDSPPAAQAVAEKIRAAVVSLVSSQHDDGGWSWSGRPAGESGFRGGSGLFSVSSRRSGQTTQRIHSDRLLSSRVVWALSAARKAGFAVPEMTFHKAVQYLRTQLTQTKREGQAILLHGLAEAGAADFAYANRLYRERNRLSVSALLHTALVLIRLDRKEMAGDLLLLVKLPTDKNSVRTQGVGGPKNILSWMHSGVELRALFLLALQQVNPADKRVGELAEWLLAARRGARWSPEKANGPAIAALAEWFSRTKFTAEKYKLVVLVNNGLVATLNIDPARDGSRRLSVPVKFLLKGKGERQKIDFEVTGRGRFSYSVVLGGFVPADKLKSTTSDWTVTRIYQPAPRLFEGQPLPRGFGILTSAERQRKTFRNPLTQLPLSEQGEVVLSVQRSIERNRTEEEGDYLVLTEPIPAGCSVVAGSVSGRFERYEIIPGAIRFYLGETESAGELRYTLIGYLPGHYRALPSMLRSFYQPQRMVLASAKSLTVLPRGQASQDVYRLTPVELLELGKRLYAQRRYKEADQHLTQLFRKYGLRASIFGEVVKLLFRTSLAVKNQPAVVEFFEIIKERYPGEIISFDEILQVAAAYRELGEYERGYLVFRSTIEAAFQRESQIAGFLDERGEFLRSVQLMERLLQNYPAESYIALATFALAQEVYGKAGEIAQHNKLREAGVTRTALIAASIRMIDHFLSNWPADPAADQAAFAMANSYLDLEDYERAIQRCQLFARRYARSKLLDSFWYVIGYSQFALGRHDEALKMVRKVAETTYKDPQTGVLVASANKWQAIYIMGQIYHSLGRPKEAVAEYRRVKNRFPDAAESIDYFTRKTISLPEVTTIQPGTAVKTTLRFRNVAAADIKVYRIDLLKFGLMQRSLNRITAINLAGIRPYHEMTLKLGDGLDFRDRQYQLALPLKEEGAYLVVCRGESLYASGLVLLSPLSLEIQEDAGSGRVRVTVRDVKSDKYAAEVEVRVIGSANREFVAGKTDLRGLFIADGILGTSTVIARSGKNHYAFFRGKTVLGPVQNPDNKKAEDRPGKQSPAGKKGQKNDLLKNLKMQNNLFNTDQRRQYRNLLRNRQKGVQSGKAF